VVSRIRQIVMESGKAGAFRSSTINVQFKMLFCDCNQVDLTLVFVST